ncbi:uncharacterized protein BO97DRAFT_457481 [Aspergillus homomorphus CBS 101889]|uniref:Uncharacterized protein n=1 Tax=Aspergillus homomorphus (strain CBS 101889) TaxID=1450537 RepID=A0A395HQK7_ASPHC|nr:hypothetical protein BO97DRAFT_457481 [Aspergillus homomorphus CBS 101889]RAL09886.1 hypothetical protein BO97DRAFT_457481 [Aspergillus homomorphus CBS 101889]
MLEVEENDMGSGSESGNGDRSTDAGTMNSDTDVKIMDGEAERDSAGESEWDSEWGSDDIDDSDDDSIELPDIPLLKEALSIVYQVIDGEVDPDTGAQRIDAPVRSVLTSPMDERRKSDEICDFSWLFWDPVLDAARGIRNDDEGRAQARREYDNEGLNHLADLMAALAHFPPVVIELGGEGGVWSMATCLGFQPDHLLHIASWAQDPRCPSERPMDYYCEKDDFIPAMMGAISFLARVMGRRIIISLSCASGSSMLGPSYTVSCTLDPLLEPGKHYLDYRPGYLYRSESEVWCQERWDFWKERITDLGKFASHNYRMVATTLVERMNEIEAQAQHESDLNSAS